MGSGREGRKADEGRAIRKAKRRKVCLLLCRPAHAHAHTHISIIIIVVIIVLIIVILFLSLLL